VTTGTIFDYKGLILLETFKTILKNMTFLEYYKIILEKVKFDTKLLVKEYKKALDALKEQEIIELHLWLDARGLRKELITCLS